jgi:ornithine carbamoyltransferase
MSKPPTHLLEIADFSPGDVRRMLDLASREPATLGRPLEGPDGRQGVALIFEKPSTRTRHSMEIAVVQLGGHPVYTRGEEIGIDVREPAEDVVRILQGYHSVIAARVFDHVLLERMATVADVPIVNMLSDRAHPLQALADALTMEEAFGSLADRRVAWVGDYNNVARSLGEISAMLGAHLAFACPQGFEPTEAELERFVLLGARSAERHWRAEDAVTGADAVHADTWVSMGQEDEKAGRIKAFEGYTVNDELMRHAAPDAVFMHCLPAYRGLEVTADVIDGSRSRVFQQGHNRLHAARGALAFLLGAL